jgi:hypothetical protein
MQLLIRQYHYHSHRHLDADEPSISICVEELVFVSARRTTTIYDDYGGNSATTSHLLLFPLARMAKAAACAFLLVFFDEHMLTRVFSIISYCS